MSIKIETKLRPMEIMGEEVKGLPNDADDLIVSAHWNCNDRVILDWHGRTITVSARELQRAIQNAINHE